MASAAVSIWHCDASGVYSGFTANNPDGPPMSPGMNPVCARVLDPIWKRQADVHPDHHLRVPTSATEEGPRPLRSAGARRTKRDSSVAYR